MWNNHIKMFATDLATGERFEITDLYWFEENGVHDFSGDGHYAKYRFEFYVWNIDIIAEALK